MRESASQTHTLLPLPLPPPPPPLSLTSPTTVPHRRHRTASSSFSSSSVSTASSSFSLSPSPAPSPRATTTSVVPFSWEHHPGIPKSSLACSASAPLPLPPLLRHSPRRRQRRRRRAASVPASSDPHADPFAAAFVECTKEDGTDDADAADKLLPAPTSTVPGRAERRWCLVGGVVVGFLDLYGCKSAMAVADGAFLARRSVVARPGPGRATRR